MVSSFECKHHHFEFCLIYFNLIFESKKVEFICTNKSSFEYGNRVKSLIW